MANNLRFSSAGNTSCWTDDAANLCSVETAMASFNNNGSVRTGYVTNNLSSYDFGMAFNDTRLVAVSMARVQLQNASRVLSYKLFNWPFASSNNLLRFSFSVGLFNYSTSPSAYFNRDGYLFELNNNSQVFVTASCVAGGSTRKVGALNYSFASGVYIASINLPNAADIEHNITLSRIPAILTASSSEIVNQTSPMSMILCADGAETCDSGSPCLDWMLFSLREVKSTEVPIREECVGLIFSMTFSHFSTLVQ